MQIAQRWVVMCACLMVVILPQLAHAIPVDPVPVGTVTIVDPSDGEVITGDVYQFNAQFVDANATTTSPTVTYTIHAGACTSLGGLADSGDMYVTGGDIARPVNLTALADGDYCFTVLVQDLVGGETSVSDRVDFTIATPSTVEVTSPFGAVSGMVDFTATIIAGYPILTSDINWSIVAGDCDGESRQVAGNTGEFEDTFTYSEGQFSTTLNTTTWGDGPYCFIVDPQEQNEGNIVIAYQSFIVGVRTTEVYGQKYEDVDGDGRLNYEVDRRVAGIPIIATNNETGAVLTTTTDAEGTYYFNLPDGVWTISEGDVRGWQLIRAYQGKILIDEGEMEEVVPLTCQIEVFSREMMRRAPMPSTVCTFLNKQVEVGSSKSGTRVNRATAGGGRVLGLATTTTSTTTPGACSMYLTSYMRMGMNNPTDQVLKLQVFLNVINGTTTVPMTGIFDEATDAAVRAFQVKYLTDILSPWNITAGTGYVYKTTRATINNMVCPGSEAVPAI